MEIKHNMKIFTAMIITPIKAYRLFISPLLGNNCRFEPTCSSYALEALNTHGPIHGVFLIAKRLIRCHPWGGHGFDPVPTQKNKNIFK